MLLHHHQWDRCGALPSPTPPCRGPPAPYRHARLPLLPAEPLSTRTALGTSRAEVGAAPGAPRGRAGCPLTHLLSSLAGDARHAASPHHRLPGGASLPLRRTRAQGLAGGSPVSPGVSLPSPVPWVQPSPRRRVPNLPSPVPSLGRGTQGRSPKPWSWQGRYGAGTRLLMPPPPWSLRGQVLPPRRHGLTFWPCMPSGPRGPMLPGGPGGPGAPSLPRGPGAPITPGAPCGTAEGWAGNVPEQAPGPCSVPTAGVSPEHRLLGASGSDAPRSKA